MGITWIEKQGFPDVNGTAFPSVSMDLNLGKGGGNMNIEKILSPEESVMEPFFLPGEKERAAKILRALDGVSIRTARRILEICGDLLEQMKVTVK